MACIYCHHEHSDFEFAITDIFNDSYDFRRCQNCGTYYLDPHPNSHQLNQAYGRDYYGEGETKFNPLTQWIFNFVKKRSLKFFTKHLSAGQQVLDIGCGDGSFLMSLKAIKHVELYGLEMEGESAKRCAKKAYIHLSVSKFKENLFEESAFDAVTLIHVFEHLPEPKEALIELNRILKTNGHLWIEIPNINSWQFKLFKKHWLHLDPPRHLNMMLPQTLIDELGNMGFECIDQSYRSVQFGPFGFQQSLLNALGFKRDVLYEYLKRNPAYYKDYSRFGLFIMQLFHWLSFPIFILTDMIAAMFKSGAVVRLAFKKKA